MPPDIFCKILQIFPDQGMLTFWYWIFVSMVGMAAMFILTWYPKDNTSSGEICLKEFPQKNTRIISLIFSLEEKVFVDEGVI